MHTTKLAAALAAALTVAAAPAAMAADNFTFVTHAKPVDGVRVPAQPAPGAFFQGAAISSISVDVTYADGTKQTVTGKCSAWRNPPNAQFPQSGVCVSPGNYEQQYSCQPFEGGKPGVNCWGYLRGTGGKYAGKSGLVTYVGEANGVSTGVGRWNDQ